MITTSPTSLAVDAVVQRQSLSYLAGYILPVLKSEPALPAEISRSVGKLSGKGWLTANAVSSYIRAIIAARNIEKSISTTVQFIAFCW